VSSNAGYPASMRQVPAAIFRFLIFGDGMGMLILNSVINLSFVEDQPA